MKWLYDDVITCPTIICSKMMIFSLFFYESITDRPTAGRTDRRTDRHSYSEDASKNESITNARTVRSTNIRTVSVGHTLLQHRCVAARIFVLESRVQREQPRDDGADMGQLGRGNFSLQWESKITDPILLVISLLIFPSIRSFFQWTSVLAALDPLLISSTAEWNFLFLIKQYAYTYFSISK